VMMDRPEREMVMDRRRASLCDNKETRGKSSGLWQTVVAAVVVEFLVVFYLFICVAANAVQVKRSLLG
jgi:hypothetical protein